MFDYVCMTCHAGFGDPSSPIQGTYSKSAIDFKEKAAEPSSPVMAVSSVRESIVAKTVKKTMALLKKCV